MLGAIAYKSRRHKMSSKIINRAFLAITVVMFCLFFQVSAQVRITSEFLRRSVDSVAVIIVNDAKLALVTCSDMDTTGKSDRWNYVYLSLDSLKEYRFHAQNNQVVFDGSYGMRVGAGVLINPWINSDSALTVAERSGGTEIRRQFPNCTLSASLMRPVCPPFLCYWYIYYKCSDITRTIVINAASIVTSITMNEGWNLVSIPLEQTDYSYTVVFPHAFGTLQSYDPIAGRYGEATTLAFGVGYWAYYIGPFLENIIGTARAASLNIACKTGWNLIGGREVSVDVGTLTSMPSGQIFSAPQKYNASTGMYQEATTLDPGVGAWIYVLSDCTIIIP
jgi:hypothetical protein